MREKGRMRRVGEHLQSGWCNEHMNSQRAWGFCQFEAVWFVDCVVVFFLPVKKKGGVDLLHNPSESFARVLTIHVLGLFGCQGLATVLCNHMVAMFEPAWW